MSKLVLDEDGTVLSGERAYDTVYNENTLVGPAAEVGNSTRGFARFCSGFLAGSEQGFDRPIYFTNEEDGGANTFDGIGGLSVAIFDNELHTLPKLGRFAKENTVVQPSTGHRTVIMSIEDGPSALDPAVENSQLYIYVGDEGPPPRRLRPRAQRARQRQALRLRTRTTPRIASELPFQDGTIAGEWVEIPGADDDERGAARGGERRRRAMRFARPEDGAFNTRNHERVLLRHDRRRRGRRTSSAASTASTSTPATRRSRGR